ncbi:MAG: MFS transporter [Spirochaetaceae bacterium]|nr:MAG: MFS transporter [Spirochaetaceae bacterium]
MSEKRTFSVSKTFLLGFGFFGVSVIWALYNAYVPIFLKSTFGLRSSVIGSIMTIDNIFAILLLPFLGALSDRTRTRLGRRRPYILVGSALALIFFVLVPFFNTVQILGLMMLTIILMNFSMAVFRSPVVALMPDITPSKYRSQANGIINFMGGLGALLVFFGGKPLYDRSVSLPFVVGGLVMFVASMMVVIFVREKLADAEAETEAVSFKSSIQELVANLKDVFAAEKSLLFILLGILFWFIGFNSIETFFTSYAKYHLGIKESTGAMILGFFSVTFMVTSIASGFLGSRIGRNRTIRVGLVILVMILLISLFVRQFLPLALVFVAGGFGWALVNVNSLPMVVDMTTLANVGGYTGLYYFFSQAANIAAPPLAGVLIDAFGYASLMIFAGLMFLIAFFIMSFVKRGEVQS